MREVALLLRELQGAGIIQDYALFGAIAQARYTDPVITLDVDVLVAIPSPDRLDPLREVYQHCAKKGWPSEGEAIRVGEWPVQFIPVFSPLTRDALELAETVDFDGTPIRVVRPDYLAVIALSTGRSKDYQRILSLLESASTTQNEVESLAARHGLGAAWKQLAKRLLDA